MFEIKTECEYGDIIRRFLQEQFPAQTLKDCDDILELLTNAIVATGKIRLGSKPTIESLFAIRQHLKAQMESGDPIRFLIPWGSEKPVDLQTVDLAELSALKTLLCLNDRVSSVYGPGIHIRVRVEDASAPALFADKKEQARINAHLYTLSFQSLVRVLVPEGFIQLVPESTLVTEEDNDKELAKIVPTMIQYITESDRLIDEHGPYSMPEFDALESYQALKALGWNGYILPTMRAYYRGVYFRTYGLDPEQSNIIFATYLSQALVRRRLNATGAIDWTDYIELAFNAPVPGIPKNQHGKRIHYRTLPEKISSFHMPPWRAKGYLAIGNEGATPRLASWSEQRSYVHNLIELEGPTGSATVRCDYEVI